MIILIISIMNASIIAKYMQKENILIWYKKKVMNVNANIYGIIKIIVEK